MSCMKFTLSGVYSTHTTQGLEIISVSSVESISPNHWQCYLFSTYSEECVYCISPEGARNRIMEDSSCSTPSRKHIH